MTEIQKLNDSYQELSQSSKLRSEASTPDVLKLSLPSQNSIDIIGDSTQEEGWGK